MLDKIKDYFVFFVMGWLLICSVVNISTNVKQTQQFVQYIVSEFKGV